MTSKYIVPGQFELIAHRGGSLEAPENTMAAFEKASQIHPQIIFELDVHPSKDGQLAVIHDATVDRTTKSSGTVSKMNWGDLKPLGIPLLRDVLEKFPIHRVTIECKPESQYYGDLVLDVIKNCKAEDRVCLASEDHQLLTKMARQAPDLCSGYSGQELVRDFYFNRFYLPFLAPTRGQVLQIPFEHNGISIATPKYIHSAHKKGKFVHVWTVNDEVTMRQLIQDGADGIITDAPTLLLKVARELKKT